MTKTLYAGPWVGEFGWELCSWNPTVRYEAKKYDRVIVEVQPGAEYLYEFATDIIINPREGDYDMYQGKVSKPSFVPPANSTILTPTRFWAQHAKTEFREIKKASRGYALHPKEWKVFGTERSEFVAEILCAFRGPKVFKGRTLPEKQYPEHQAIQLVNLLLEAGYSVACFGGTDNLHVPGTVDLRGISLMEICGNLSEAKLVIGPSSGTIHLASLCKTPHVTWYGRPIVSLDRYMSYWNPFSTPVTFINVPCPDPELIFKTSVGRMSSETPTFHTVSN